jgi:two-component system sensor histidine kinase CpxA
MLMKLNTRSLFIKIFLWFWLVTALTGVILFVVAISGDTARNRNVQQQRAEERRRQMAETLSFYGETAVKLLFLEGPPAITAYSDQLAHTVGIKSYFFLQPNQPLPNERVPDVVIELAQRSRLSGKTEYATRRDEFVLAQPLLNSTGNLYVVVGKTRLDPGVSAAPESKRPSPEAEEACRGKVAGDDCSFDTLNHLMSGKCQTRVDTPVACIPGKSLPDGLFSQPAVDTAAAKSHPSILFGSRFVTRAVSHLDQYSRNLGKILVIIFFVGGAACYLLTWHLTAPLRRLQQVAQKLASGDLSVRVDSDLKHRGDEIAELGGDLNRMAEQLESMFNSQQRLMCDISHELRSPLTRLSVALDLARKTAGSDATSSLDRIERESNRLNELIGQLLTLSKLENEKVYECAAVVDLTALLSEIARDADFEVHGINRRVQLTSCPSVTIHGNRELLRQAFENVVRNALRYTVDGSNVELSLNREGESQGNRVVVEVRDHGSGVPDKELTNIFRPFYRVSDGRERESGGVGIGLAITDRAVRLHGGSVQALNAQDGGLIVIIYIPLIMLK